MSACFEIKMRCPPLLEGLYCKISELKLLVTALDFLIENFDKLVLNKIEGSENCH